jgi:DNA polymerase-3 subunit alpha
MAFVTLEDFSGTGEVLVFSDQYELHKTLVANDSLILVRGQISAKEGDNKVVASEIMSLPEARSKLARSLVVTVTPEQTTEDTIGSLKETFSTHPGECAVLFKILTQEYGEVSIKAGGHIRVAPTTELLLAVRKMLGTNRARLAGAALHSSNSGWTVINDGNGRGRGRNGNGRWNGNGNGNGYGE